MPTLRDLYEEAAANGTLGLTTVSGSLVVAARGAPRATSQSPDARPHRPAPPASGGGTHAICMLCRERSGARSSERRPHPVFSAARAGDLVRAFRQNTSTHIASQIALHPIHSAWRAKTMDVMDRVRGGDASVAPSGSASERVISLNGRHQGGQSDGDFAHKGEGHGTSRGLRRTAQTLASWSSRLQEAVCSRPRDTDQGQPTPARITTSWRSASVARLFDLTRRSRVPRARCTRCADGARQ